MDEHTFANLVLIICKKTRDEVALSKRKTYCVKIDKVTTEAWCECKLFESHGILCRRIIIFMMFLT